MSVATGILRPMRRAARASYRAAGPLLGAALGSVVRIEPARDMVIMTFDDGPDPHWTPALLEVLATHRATATFFMLGTSVRRHPREARMVQEAGQEVALHGNDHRRTTSLARTEFAREIVLGKRAVEEATGAPVQWFRPPYGAQNLGTWRATVAAGLTPVMWTGTFWDWRDIPQAERVAKALDSTEPGGIALAHDRHADASDGVHDGASPQLDRADLLDQVLTSWTSRGLRAVSVRDALAQGASLVKRPWFPREAPIHHNAAPHPPTPTPEQ